MPRVRRIIDIGSGVNPHKAVGLAARHPRKKFVAVDKDPINVTPSLQRHSLTKTPTNLEIHSNTNARELLRRAPNNYFSHAYSYLVLDNMNSVDRVHTIHQLHRTLQPGATYTVLASGERTRTFTRELTAAGFVVTEKSVSPSQVRKMGSYGTEFNADLVESVFRKTGYAAASGKARQAMHDAVYAEIVRFTSTIEPNLSRFGKQALREARRDIERFFSHPFVLLKAKKRRK